MDDIERLEMIRARAERARTTLGPWIIGVGESVRISYVDPDIEWLLTLVDQQAAELSHLRERERIAKAVSTALKDAQDPEDFYRALGNLMMEAKVLDGAGN